MTEEELLAKLRARDQIYKSLTDQLGPLISQLAREHVALEVVVPASASLPEPGADMTLRYERRAQTLADQRRIAAKITYTEHYLPVVSSLLNPPAL